MSETQPVVFLKGRNVSLRPMEKTDLPNCARWINDPEIRDFVKVYFPMTMTDEEAWFATIGKRKPNDLLLAMVTNDGKHIGNMAIHRIDWRSRVGTTGALIGAKDTFRASKVRRTSPLTSARVLPKTTHAANQVLSPRLASSTTQLADWFIPT